MRKLIAAIVVLAAGMAVTSSVWFPTRGEAQVDGAVSVSEKDKSSSADPALFERLFPDAFICDVKDSSIVEEFRIAKKQELGETRLVTYHFEYCAVPSGRRYLSSGSRAIDVVTSSKSQRTLADIREYMGITMEKQRALSVKFWIGRQESDTRYCVGERLFDIEF